jgi:hypothetical protein
MRGRAEDADPAGAVLDDRQHVQPGAGKVTVSKKSQVSSASVWDRRKSAQGAVVRSRAGSTPACRRDLPHSGDGCLDPQDEQLTVDPAVTPSKGSPVPGAAPAGGWSGRCAVGPGSSDATSPRGGEPAGPGASAALSLAGLAAGTGPARLPGRRCSRAAISARSLGKDRGRVLPSCRSRTVIWCRSARISPSLSRSLTGRNRSNANTFVTLR